MIPVKIKPGAQFEAHPFAPDVPAEESPRHECIIEHEGRYWAKVDIGVVPLEAGDWIVADSSGRLHVFRFDAFDRLFEPTGGTEPGSETIRVSLSAQFPEAQAAQVRALLAGVTWKVNT